MDYSQIKVLINLKEFDRALFYLHQFEALYPSDKEINFLLADTYNHLNNHFEAERYFRKTIALDPNYLPAYTHLEQVIRDQARYSECREILATIRNIMPSLDGIVKCSLAMLDLTEGDLKNGFQAYENRFAFKHMLEAYGKPIFPRWDGKSSLQGKSILLRYEQGLGDTLQFSRYARILSDLGAVKVGVLCKKILFRIVQTIPGVSETIDNEDIPKVSYDLEAMMMSMPALLHTETPGQIPGWPYYRVTPDDSTRWLHKMQPTGKFRVGLVWSGELKKGLKSWEAERMNQRRSIPLDQWRPLLESDCDFYGLQKGEMQTSLKELHAIHPIKDIMHDVHDFYDTACIVDNLDLVITVDTSVAHLVGGLGKPVWMLSRVDGDWRWGFKKTSTPWYPSMRIFCQDTFAEWRPTMKVVAAELEKLSTSVTWERVKKSFMREPHEIPLAEKEYYKDLIKCPPGTTPLVLNVTFLNFSYIRNGDLIALLNILEHLRRRENNRNIKFYIEPEALYDTPYCKEFLKFITKETNYISKTKGSQSLDFKYRSVWNYRMALGDVIKLSIKRPRERKIYINPVFDAPYNTNRNWSTTLTQSIIDRFSTDEFKGYTKLIGCLALPSGIDLREFKLSTDFMTNVNHIISSETFVGGDTGLSHFASAIKDGPKCIFYIPEDSARNTYPLFFETAELNKY